MELITLEDICKTYHLGEQDVPVLKGVSMTVARGEFVALTGASGSGKSTLMNILGCLDRPTGGRYWLDGEDVSRLTPEERAVARGRKIGFVFQNFSLLPRTSALDNVMMPLTYARPRPSAAESRRRAEEALRLDPELFAAYFEFSSVPWRAGVLEPKVKEFVYVAIDASTTHMFDDGTRGHMANAFKHGATVEELLEVIELCVPLGIQSVMAGLPILDEEVEIFQRETGEVG